MWGIHRSPVNSPHKGQWRGALIFSLIRAWINGWLNNREAGDLRRDLAHYDVTVMAVCLIGPLRDADLRIINNKPNRLEALSEAWTKWPTLCKRQFQSHLFNENIWIKKTSSFKCVLGVQYRIWSLCSMPCEKHGPRESVNKNRGQRPMFLPLLSPEGHFFHTARETVIKSYYSTLTIWLFFSFYSQKYEFQCLKIDNLWLISWLLRKWYCGYELVAKGHKWIIVVKLEYLLYFIKGYLVE